MRIAMMTRHLLDNISIKRIILNQCDPLFSGFIFDQGFGMRDEFRSAC